MSAPLSTGRPAAGEEAAPRDVMRHVGDKITSKLDAVRALQALVRERLQLPTDRANGKAEPCAWAALYGECNKKGCESCAGKLTMPEDLVKTVQAKCSSTALRVK